MAAAGPSRGDVSPLCPRAGWGGAAFVGGGGVSQAGRRQIRPRRRRIYDGSVERHEAGAVRLVWWWRPAGWPALAGLHRCSGSASGAARRPAFIGASCLRRSAGFESCRGVASEAPAAPVAGNHHFLFPSLLFLPLSVVSA
jgi:hypothetical protein